MFWFTRCEIVVAIPPKVSQRLDSEMFQRLILKKNVEKNEEMKKAGERKRRGSERGTEKGETYWSMSGRNGRWMN